MSKIKRNIGLFGIIIISGIIIWKSEYFFKKKQEQNVEYTKNQQLDILNIIKQVIIPGQKNFPTLLTFKKPKKLFISNSNGYMPLQNDSITISYLTKDMKLFHDSNLSLLLHQNNLKLDNLNQIKKELNLADIDSTKGSITKVVYIPIINSENDNAFIRVVTLDSGHFLDITDYWLNKIGNEWVIKKEDMIAVH